MDAAISFPDRLPPQPDVAFGTLVDLARLRFGSSSAEVCDVCNTINIGSPRYCKGCSHKLPAFYAAAEDDTKELRPHDAPPGTWRTLAMPNRPSSIDFAAFLVAVLLIAVTEFMPIQ